MTRAPSPLVLFAAAAGPELGFGHLVRCAVLADALGVRRELALRGSVAVDTALRFGWTIHQGPDLASHLQPDLVVVDDPSAAHTARWVRAARRLGILVASVHDGHGSRAAAAVVADLTIDGSVLARPRSLRVRSPRLRSGLAPRTHSGQTLAGPSFAMLAPRVARLRSRPPIRRADCVLVALGGGVHVQRLGAAVAAEILRLKPAVRVDLAAGFVAAGRAPALPSGCRWVMAPEGLADLLASASVAVVGGGITLYEACALGAPAVAVPVVAAQRRAIRAAAAAGAVIDAAGRQPTATPARIARLVAHLLDHPAAAAACGRRGARLVDGLGAARVAAALQTLIASHISGGTRHAA